jgi:hypothetical protein
MDTWIKQAFEERSPLQDALFAEVVPKLRELAKDLAPVTGLKIEAQTFDPIGDRGPEFPTICMIAGERPESAIWRISSNAAGMATITQDIGMPGDRRERVTTETLPLSELNGARLRGLLTQLVDHAQQKALRSADRSSANDHSASLRHYVTRAAFTDAVSAAKNLLLMTLGIVGAVLLVLKLSGFCFRDSEWKSNRELIQAAFRHELKGGWSNTPQVTDIEGYMRDYPECCSVGGANAFLANPFLDALFGARYYAVRIKYPVSDSGREPYYESILIMDCCGGDVPDSYGTGSSTPVPKGPAPRRQRALISTD